MLSCPLHGEQRAILAWNPSPDTGVAGYTLYYGVASRQYANSVDAGLATSNTVADLQVGTTYYFAVTARATNGVESDFSNEVSFRPNFGTNTAPVPNAGPDLTVTLPNSATLAGAVNDDGLPNPPGSTAVTWSKVSGPGTVSFGNASAANTTASFSANGSYVLRLTANDGALTAADDVTVTVLPLNRPPVAAASATPSSGDPPLAVTFSSAGSVDPEGAALSYAWDFGDGTSSASANPSHTYQATGFYLARLTVSDGVHSASTGGVKITVGNPPTGLVAAYGFEEGNGTTIADAAGNGNTGTITAATSTKGKFGNALDFDGATAAVVVGGSSSLDLTTGMTLEAWVYPTALGGWRDVVYRANDTYYLEASSSQGQEPAAGGRFSTSPLLGTTALPLNAWSHLATTYDGATLRLYVNGVEMSSRAQTGLIATAPQATLSIGGDPVSGTYFAGRIDEVRVYNRALNAGEIQSDMNTPVTGTTNRPPVLQSVPNQVARIDQTLVVTNAALDPDGTAQTLRFSLAPDAPTGATIDPVTGVFRWQPSLAQASLAHTITVRVTDNGALPLTATTRFSVWVRNPLEVQAGSVSLRAGERGNVAVSVSTHLPLATLCVVVEYAPDYLTEMALDNALPNLAGASLTPLAPGRSLLCVSSQAGAPLVGTQAVVRMGFTAVRGQTTALIPMNLSAVQAQDVDGQLLNAADLRSGRVVVVGDQLMLEAFQATNGARALALYGDPPAAASLDMATNAVGAPVWRKVADLQVTNLVQSITNLPPKARFQLFRARKL